MCRFIRKLPVLSATTATQSTNKIATTSNGDTQFISIRISAGVAALQPARFALGSSAYTSDDPRPAFFLVQSDFHCSDREHCSCELLLPLNPALL